MHGDTVSPDGIIRYLSVSQMNTAESCLRKWHFEKIGKRKEEGTFATGLGTEIHEQIETYSKTGDRKVLGSIANAGFHLLQEPGEDLQIEKDMLTRLFENLEVTAENSKTLLSNAILRAADVPVLGFIDLVHNRGTNKGGSEVSETRDPAGTWEVLDYKTTSDFKWAKKGQNLIQTAQMSGYGKWILNQKPEVKNVRLSHAYFRTKGAPAAKKETALFRAEEINKSWEHWNGIARLMVDAAKEKDSNKVNFNLDACFSYGKPCHCKVVCTAGMDIGVSAVLGITQARKFAEKQQGTEKVIPMGSLLKKVNKKIEEAKPEPEVTENTETMAEAKARLKAEEISALIPPDFVRTWHAIKALQNGTPRLTGKAAKALWATLGGTSSIPVEGTGSFEAGGDFDHVVVDDMDTLMALLEEMGSSSEEEMVSPLPPDAPESNPALAYKETAVEESVTVTEETPPPKKESAIAKVVAAAGPKEKKVKEPKAAPHHGDQLKLPAITVTVDKEMVENLVKAGIEAHTTQIRLYIDCVPSVPYEDLYSWCNTLADEMAANLPSVDKNGNSIDTDIRASNNKALDFGKWEGTLSAIARSAEHSPLKPGVYFIDTKGSRLRAIIADSLKARASASGGYYVRGGNV